MENLKWPEDFINKVICGDCLEVMKQMPDNCVDLVITDPPYGHNNNNRDMIANWEKIFKKGRDVGVPRPIINDGKEANDLFRACIKEYFRLLKRGGCCCCCCGGGGGPDPQFARWSLWLDEVLQFKQMIIWDKGPMGMGFHYRRSYECVLVAQKIGAKCNWYADNNDIENIIRPGDYGICKIIPTIHQHPTEKPIALAKHFIRLHSKSNDLILDPFMGHGFGVIAAKQLGRRFIGIEIDPNYCEIALKRLAQEEIFNKSG